MTRARARAVAALVLFGLPLTGCLQILGLALDAEPGADPTPALFAADVFVGDLATVAAGGTTITTSGVRVSGRLDPGTTRDGSVRRILSDTVRVMGLVVRPDTFSLPHEPLYRSPLIALPASRIGAEVIVVDLPRVRGVSSPVPALRVTGVGRADPDTIPLRADSVVLHLRLPAVEPVPAPGERAWSLLLTDGAVQVTLRGAGLPPPRLVIPPELLPASASPRVRVQLDVVESHGRFGVAFGDFTLLATVRSTLRWTVLR